MYSPKLLCFRLCFSHTRLIRSFTDRCRDFLPDHLGNIANCSVPWSRNNLPHITVESTTSVRQSCGKLFGTPIRTNAGSNPQLHHSKHTQFIGLGVPYLGINLPSKTIHMPPPPPDSPTMSPDTIVAIAIGILRHQSIADGWRSPFYKMTQVSDISDN